MSPIAMVGGILLAVLCLVLAWWMCQPPRRTCKRCMGTGWRGSEACAACGTSGLTR